MRRKNTLTFWVTLHVVASAAGKYKYFRVVVFPELVSCLFSPSLCLFPSKFIIMLMVTDRLMVGMGPVSILPVKWSVAVTF